MALHSVTPSTEFRQLFHRLKSTVEDSKITSINLAEFIWCQLERHEPSQGFVRLNHPQNPIHRKLTVTTNLFHSTFFWIKPSLKWAMNVKGH